MTLAVSADGVTFDRLFWLVGNRHIDYPHIIEHDGRLLIAFSGAKQTMEVMSVKLNDLEALAMPGSVALEKPAPGIVQSTKTANHWIDLGDEGATLNIAFEMTVPDRGNEALLRLATASGANRVAMGVDSEGHLVAEVFKARTRGEALPVGRTVLVRARIRSRTSQPDELIVRVESKKRDGVEGNPSDEWVLANREGRSDANLSRSIFSGEGSIRGLRITSDLGQIRDK